MIGRAQYRSRPSGKEVPRSQGSRCVCACLRLWLEREVCPKRFQMDAALGFSLVQHQSTGDGICSGSSGPGRALEVWKWLYHTGAYRGSTPPPHKVAPDGDCGSDPPSPHPRPRRLAPIGGHAARAPRLPPALARPGAAAARRLPGRCVEDDLLVITGLGEDQAAQASAVWPMLR